LAISTQIRWTSSHRPAPKVRAGAIDLLSVTHTGSNVNIQSVWVTRSFILSGSQWSGHSVRDSVTESVGK
jgi:hypothetical protein